MKTDIQRCNFNVLKKGLCVFFFLVMLISCGIISKDDPPELDYGPRHYVWSEETFEDLPGGHILDFWGFQPDDIWALRAGQQNLWHFDGNNWNVWPEKIGLYPRTIFGLATDDIYIGGVEGRIFHYDGVDWDLVFRFEKEGYRISNINDIWGNSASDVYATGVASADSSAPPYYSFVLHYDGRDWQELVFTDFDFQIQRVRGDRGGLFLHGVKPNYGDARPRTQHIFRYSSDQLQEIFSITTSETPGTLRMNSISGNIFFLKGREVYRQYIGKFVPLLNIEMEIEPYDIMGRNINDLFFNSREGIYHYNGENTVQLIEIPSDKNFRGVRNTLIFEDEVFFNVVDLSNGDHVLYHGQLKNPEF